MNQFELFIKFITILFWLGMVPYFCGFPMAIHLKQKEEKVSHGMIFTSGYFVLISLFQIVYLIFVLFYNHFTPLVVVFAILICIVAFVSALYALVYSRGRGQRKKVTQEKKKSTLILWIVFLGLLGFILYKTLFFSYYDGDDAFYTVLSVITDTNDNMYRSLPYTGESASLDKRHAFSSAPVLISFFARVCGVHPTVMTNTAFSFIVVIITMILYKLLADCLFKKDRNLVPLFLCLITGLYLFGNTTIYQDTTFLMTRTGQGKAFLANTIPVAILLGLFLLYECYQNKKSKVPVWIYLSLVMITSGYTSTMGLFLAPLLVGGGSLLLAIRHRDIKLMGQMFFAMLPLLLMGSIYLIVLGGL